KGLCVLPQATLGNTLCQARTFIHAVQAPQYKANQTLEKYQRIALNEYTVNRNVVVRCSGIEVCRNAPYLSCSPDGLVGCDSFEEVKYFGAKLCHPFLCHTFMSLMTKWPSKPTSFTYTKL
ncbi:hypothetical protein LSH36_1524g00000, partial [Paralvinella palmiformis]